MTGARASHAADAAILTRYSYYKHRSLHRWGYFGLTREQFTALFRGNCHYCGAAPMRVARVGPNCSDEWRAASVTFYNGIDRVDNALGYTFANCVTACFICNQAKHALTLAEFTAWVQRIAAHQARVTHADGIAAPVSDEVPEE
jgi:5-methylcytosine-specific restriction endonuclease McrA